MKEKVTIYDISKKLNVSAATVSRALNDNPKISPITKALVVKTAREMNYKQNRLAQALKSGKSNNVGVIVPYINRSFFSSVIRGIEEELRPKGYHVIICQTHEKEEIEIEQINTLLNTQIDGIFMSVAKTTRNTDHILKAHQEGVPLIFFDRKKDIEGISSVIIDDFKGGYLATKHLIEQGAKKLAHLAGDLNLDIYKQRLAGFKAAIEEAGLKIYSDFIIEINSKVEDGERATKELWKLKEKPDAIFAAGDYTALGAIKVLKKKGIKIPEDICISGFSNEPFTKYMETPITSVDQTPQLMGKISAQVFLEIITGSELLTMEKKIVLTPELLVRESSKKK